MTRDECIDILRAAIWHSEQLHEKEITFTDEDGKVIGRGRVEAMQDDMYQALKYALSCVENQA